jgi:hypothetical protein
MGGEEESYESRVYTCPQCHAHLSGFEVLRQSPPEFLLQPHDLYPMTRKEFNYWLAILKKEFPDHPYLSKPSRKFSPRTSRQAHTRRPAVVEMTDEESSKSIEPEFDTAIEWLDVMSEPGANLDFHHKNGGKLTVTLTDRGTFHGVSRTSRGKVRRNRKGLDRTAVENLIGSYVHGKGWRLAVRKIREFTWYLKYSKSGWGSMMSSLCRELTWTQRSGNGGGFGVTSE